MSEFIPMSRPFIGEEEIDEVAKVLRSGWITTGPKCKEFEDIYASLTGAKEGIALVSATAGMHLSLKALGIGPGDEVITPSMTFASTVNQIALAGAKPVFADCDYDTLMVKPHDIARLITKKTKAIIPVHFAGAPADIDAIEAAAGNIPVIEDAAHAIDTHYKGRHIGSKNLSIFSFHPIKNITTTEGGMITGNDEKLMKRIRILRFHGIERDAWKRYGKGSDPNYDIAEPGYKYNMTDVQAAIGIAQMKKLDIITRKRQDIAKAYLSGMKNIKGIDLPGAPPYEHMHSWHLFVVKVIKMSRGEFMAALAEENIGYGLHFPACHTLKYVKELFGETNLPVTEEVSEKILSLPIYPSMTDQEVTSVIDAVKRILG